MNLQVLENRNDGDNNFSLILQKPPGFNFYAGQYLDIKLPAGKDNIKTFTISTSPTEDFLMITAKKGVSQFKKIMQNLAPGDNITVTHPIGTFILDESQKNIYIAGGIGITPFRSMIKFAVDQNIKQHMTLIYLNSSDNFLFKDALGKFQKDLPNLNIIYRQTKLQGRPNTKDLKAVVQDNTEAIYYLAGPTEMVDSFDKMLSDLGVDKVNIRTDRFDGY